MFRLSFPACLSRNFLSFIMDLFKVWGKFELRIETSMKAILRILLSRLYFWIVIYESVSLTWRSSSAAVEKIKSLAITVTLKLN